MELKFLSLPVYVQSDTLNLKRRKCFLIGLGVKRIKLTVGVYLPILYLFTTWYPLCLESIYSRFLFVILKRIIRTYICVSK